MTKLRSNQHDIKLKNAPRKKTVAIFRTRDKALLYETKKGEHPVRLTPVIRIH